MSSAVAGYKATLGSDAPPACYDDIDAAKILFIAGSNTAWAHPILYRRIEAARQRDASVRTIVVDPRRTATAADADLHLQIEPGTDVALFNGMLHVMLWEDLVDREFIAAHTEGFEALRTTVREYTPKVVAQTCGIARTTFSPRPGGSRGGRHSRCTARASTNRRPARPRTATLVNLHLATGQIGREGAGPFSLTGQPNAMGGRESAGSPISFRRIATWPIPRIARRSPHCGASTCPETPGLTAVELFDALAAGRVKMVWIACTNPAQSMPDQATVREGLARAELVVLQEAYADTETSAFAHIELPASSWGEKEGTVTNSERRISRVRAALRPPARRARTGRSLPTSRDASKIACGQASDLFPYASAAQVFDEHVRTTAGATSTSRDCRTRSSTSSDRSSGRAARTKTRDRAPLHRLPLRDADGRARFLAAKYAPGSGARRRALSVPSQHRTLARPVACDVAHRHGAVAVRARGRTGNRAPLCGYGPSGLAGRGSRARGIATRQRRRAGDRFRRGAPRQRVPPDALGRRHARRSQ
jgi:assimilatory nitrate reductase catalytic subunit